MQYSVKTFHSTWLGKGCFLTLFGLLIYLISYIIGWGEYSESLIGIPAQYCELGSDGLFREPMNSISNFAYIGVGLLLLWEADQQPEYGPNPFSRKSLISPLYGISAVFLGLGSLAMHGTQTQIGGFLDWGGMMLWMTVFVGYSVGRVLRWDESTTIRNIIIFTITYLVIDFFRREELAPDWGEMEGLGFLRHFVWNSLIGIWLMIEADLFISRKEIRHEFRMLAVFLLPVIALIVLDAPKLRYLVLQIILFLVCSMILTGTKNHPISRPLTPWLPLGVTSFILGLLIWNIGQAEQSGCNPESLLQLHAGWHLFTAFTFYAFHRHLKGEISLDLD